MKITYIISLILVLLFFTFHPTTATIEISKSAISLIKFPESVPPNQPILLRAQFPECNSVLIPYIVSSTDPLPPTITLTITFQYYRPPSLGVISPERMLVWSYPYTASLSTLIFTCAEVEIICTATSQVTIPTSSIVNTSALNIILGPFTFPTTTSNLNHYTLVLKSTTTTDPDITIDAGLDAVTLIRPLISYIAYHTIGIDTTQQSTFEVIATNGYFNPGQEMYVQIGTADLSPDRYQLDGFVYVSDGTDSVGRNVFLYKTIVNCSFKCVFIAPPANSIFFQQQVYFIQWVWMNYPQHHSISIPKNISMISSPTVITTTDLPPVPNQPIKSEFILPRLQGSMVYFDTIPTTIDFPITNCKINSAIYLHPYASTITYIPVSEIEPTITCTGIMRYISTATNIVERLVYVYSGTGTSTQPFQLQQVFKIMGSISNQRSINRQPETRVQKIGTVPTNIDLKPGLYDLSTWASGDSFTIEFTPYSTIQLQSITHLEFRPLPQLFTCIKPSNQYWIWKCTLLVTFPFIYNDVLPDISLNIPIIPNVNILNVKITTTRVLLPTTQQIIQKNVLFDIIQVEHSAIPQFSTTLVPCDILNFPLQSNGVPYQSRPPIDFTFTTAPYRNTFLSDGFEEGFLSFRDLTFTITPTIDVIYNRIPNNISITTYNSLSFNPPNPTVYTSTSTEQSKLKLTTTTLNPTNSLPHRSMKISFGLQQNLLTALCGTGTKVKEFQFTATDPFFLYHQEDFIKPTWNDVHIAHVVITGRIETRSIDKISQYYLPTLHPKYHPYCDDIIFTFGHARAMFDRRYTNQLPLYVAIKVIDGDFDILTNGDSLTTQLSATNNQDSTTFNYPSMNCAWSLTRTIPVSNDPGNTNFISHTSNITATAPSTYTWNDQLYSRGTDETNFHQNTANIKGFLGVYQTPQLTDFVLPVLGENIPTIEYNLQLYCKYILPTTFPTRLDLMVSVHDVTHDKISFSTFMSTKTKTKLTHSSILPLVLQSPLAPTLGPNLQPFVSLFVAIDGAPILNPTKNITLTSSFNRDIRPDDSISIQITNLPPFIIPSTNSFWCPAIQLTQINYMNNIMDVSFIMTKVAHAQGISNILVCSFKVYYDRLKALPTHDLHYYPQVIITTTDARNTIDPSIFPINVTPFSNTYLPFERGLTIEGCESGSFGTNCNSQPIPPPTIQNITTTPPPIQPTLPIKIPSLRDHCDVIIDVQGNEQYIYDDRYNTMCSIPVAGTIIKQTISSPTEISNEIVRQELILNNKITNINICDCLCKGYWIDEPTTLDYKKCSKCSIPSCPLYMTPNNDCTACECITQECKKYTTYLFSTIYFQPQLLRYIESYNPLDTTIDYNNSTILLEQLMSSNDMDKYIHNISSLTKFKYQSIIDGFGIYLNNIYTNSKIYNNNININHIDKITITSIINGITITPLIEGIYTAWKITLSILNTSSQPISKLSTNNYGLPLLLSTIPIITSSLDNTIPAERYITLNEIFIEYLQSRLLLPTQLYSNDFKTQLNLLIHTPSQQQQQQSSSSPSSSTTTTTPIQWFLNDSFSTKCITENDYQLFQQSPTIPLSLSILKPCPTNNQYIKTGDNNKNNQLNPLWSSCSTTTIFDNYDSLLLPTITTTIIPTRRIFPVCIDFTSTNLQLYNIPCVLPQPYYNTKTNSLLLSSYITSLLSLIDMNTLSTILLDNNNNDNIITDMILHRLNTIIKQQLPKFPLFPQSIYATCQIDEGIINKNDDDNNNIICEYPKYGNNCQHEYNIDYESLTVTPTAIGNILNHHQQQQQQQQQHYNEQQQHLHLQWSYEGDDKQYITLVLKSNLAHNNGDDEQSQQFIWSQILGTFPMSYLYSTTQLPTFNNSILFQTIYNTIQKQELYSIPPTQYDSTFLSLYNITTNTNNNNNDNDNNNNANINNQTITPITLYGYLTNNANELIQLDSTQLISQFSLLLPMLCNENNIICNDNESQYCYQPIGRCQCKPGYIDISNNNNDTINIDENGNIIEIPLQCTKLCLNNGIYNPITDKCDCDETISYGQRCEIMKSCQDNNNNNENNNNNNNNKKKNDIDIPPPICGYNGYFPYDINTQTCLNTNHNNCQCYHPWLNEQYNPLHNINDDNNNDDIKCSYCPLKPFNELFYTNEQLEQIKQYYSNLYIKYQIDSILQFSLDDKFTQQYQLLSTTTRTSSPTTTPIILSNQDIITIIQDKQNDIQDYDENEVNILQQLLLQQRCYIGGIDINESFHINLQSKDNIKRQELNNLPHPITPQSTCQCKCKQGYYGEYCQLHVTYITFTYNITNPIQYHYDELMTLPLLQNKFCEELTLSLSSFEQDNCFIDNFNSTTQSVTIGLKTGLDFFQRNYELKQQEDENEYQLQLQQQQSPSPFPSLQQYFVNILQTNNNNKNITNPNPKLPIQLDSLYNQWNGLQTTFPTTPLNNQDTTTFLGPINPPQPIQDPACYDQGIIGCSGDPPKVTKKSMTGIIIGIVVAIVLAILIFILLVCLLLWCKRNERGLWKSKEQQDKDEMSSFTFTPKQEYTKSTAAPKSTITTSSMVPMKANGVEMSSTTTNNDSQRTTTTTTSVQSINNHTEVNDPTLPSHVKAYKDAKGQIFYVDSETMKTSWNHPNATTNTSDGTNDDYGSGW